MELSNAKGTKDFPPEEEILKQQVLGTLKSAFERYGFNPFDTPVLERLDVLASKYAGGNEILKEIFKLKDQGDRDLALRYDLTVPFSRFIGMNPNLKMPFKRYQIGPVFRDGPIKLGRYRQFTQCDVDVVGISAMTAEAEIIMLSQEVFEKLELDTVIKVNNRKVLNAIVEAADIKISPEDVILTLDKLEKVGAKAIEEELKSKKVSAASIKKLMELTSIKGTNLEKMEILEAELVSDEGKKGMAEIRELFSYLDDADNVEFDVSLARGLAYYTGTVFEAFLKKSEIKSAIAAGGRYDEMIGKFLNKGKDFPAVGISFGLDVIVDALQLMKKKSQKSVAQVYVISIKTLPESLRITTKLRKAGIKADIDLIGKGISKNLDYANALGIPNVIFIGDDELKKQKVKLRNMVSGKEELLSVEECVKAIESQGLMSIL